MRAAYVIHIVAAGLGLLAGYVALYATKGGTLHRRSGMLFFYTMLTMTFVGGLIAAVRGVAPGINIPAAVVTAYLVITGLLTIRPVPSGPRWLHVALMLVALAVGATSLAFGFEAAARGGTRDGIPAFPFFLFAVVALTGGVSDVRIVRFGGLHGTARLARHLWRMSFALFIAAMSFFLGQADELPAAMRIPALLAAPVVAVLVTMLYWLWRVGVRRRVRGIAVGRPRRVQAGLVETEMV